MPNLIIGAEKIYSLLFVSPDGGRTISYQTFRRKYLPELYRACVVQKETTILGARATAYDTVLVQWKREKFSNPK